MISRLRWWSVLGKYQYEKVVLNQRCLSSVSPCNQKHSPSIEEQAGTTHIDFEAVRPFERKSYKELVRAWTVLKVSSYNIIVDNAERVSVNTTAMTRQYYYK